MSDPVVHTEPGGMKAATLYEVMVWAIGADGLILNLNSIFPIVASGQEEAIRQGVVFAKEVVRLSSISPIDVDALDFFATIKTHYRGRLVHGAEI